MDNLIYITFICVMVPMFMLLFLLEKKARLTVGFMMIGIFVCLFVSEINGVILNVFDKDYFYVTTTFTPITEEIIKALPVLYFAIIFSDKRETLISVSMATGIGFAILENLVILLGSIDNVTLLWALVRGFGSGLMHGICTATVGIGISFVHKKRKLFFTGTFALLTMAIIYHAIYNCLVQSDYKYFGFVLPVTTYIPLIYFVIKIKKKDLMTKMNKKTE